jgi:hypothetical protein
MLGIKVHPLNFLLTRESIPFGLRQLGCTKNQKVKISLWREINTKIWGKKITLKRCQQVIGILNTKQIDEMREL